MNSATEKAIMALAVVANIETIVFSCSNVSLSDLSETNRTRTVNSYGIFGMVWPSYRRSMIIIAARQSKLITAPEISHAQIVVGVRKRTLGFGRAILLHLCFMMKGAIPMCTFQ